MVQPELPGQVYNATLLYYYVFVLFSSLMELSSSLISIEVAMQVEWDKLLNNKK